MFRLWINIHRVHCQYEDVDKWATVPDCVEIMVDMLEEDSLLGNQENFSPASARGNIQKHLRERGIEPLHASNADFYKTIDIASEAARELKKYTAGQFLKEFNVIASPRDNLRRATKNK